MARDPLHVPAWWRETIGKAPEHVRNQLCQLSAYVPEVPVVFGSGKKTEKGATIGVETIIAYLSPHAEWRQFLPTCASLCDPERVRYCAALCLGHSSGRLVMTTSRVARLWKSAMFTWNRGLFYHLIMVEVAQLAKRCKRSGMVPAVRLNGCSDLPGNVAGWLEQATARLGSTARWYDYTKRMVADPDDATRPDRDYYGRGKVYRVYSYDGTTEGELWALRMLQTGAGNVAVVARSRPSTMWGFPTIDGDATDARFLDTPDAGAVVLLSPKGALARRAALRGSPFILP